MHTKTAARTKLRRIYVPRFEDFQVYLDDNASINILPVAGFQVGPTFPYFSMKMPYYPNFFTKMSFTRKIQKFFLARLARLDFIN